ncbi:hypothetical protein GCM10009623_02720 [Nocardioides aestuarii]
MRVTMVVLRWAARSNERGLANAREAATALSRLRVEREEVELYLARRHALPPQAVVTDVRVAGEPR